MKSVILCLLAVSFCGTSPASAIDLTQVPRTINKEPAYQGDPKYALLVFGPEATTRVWLVHDGDTLYADLNGNGDLTEPSERFAANESSNPDDGTYRFDLGEVQEGDRRHQRLSVYTTNLQHLIHSDSRVKSKLTKDPKTRFYSLHINLEMTGNHGQAADGRVECRVSPLDRTGLLLFSGTPEDAPIIHFGGPWQIALYDQTTLTIGRQKEVYLGVGTPGLGPGTTAYVEYRKLIPEGLFPKVQITFPGDNADTTEHVFRKRCCYVNFHDGVRVPTEIQAGEATVTVSFDEWLAGNVAPTTHLVKVVEPEVKITLEPVSSRLKFSLTHPVRDGKLVGIAYSPDGKQILAGDDMTGVIQVWNAETGEQLTTIETGHGWPFDGNFHHSLDWTTVVVPKSESHYEQVEVDGKVMQRWTFEGEIREWDLATGQLLRTLHHDPPRGIFGINPSKDGRFWVTGEKVSGTYEHGWPLSLSLWNVETGRVQVLCENCIPESVYSPDQNTLAISNLDESSTTSIDLIDLQSGRETLTIPISESRTVAVVTGFSPNGHLMYGRFEEYEGESSRSFKRAFMKFWEVATGREISAIPIQERENFSWPPVVSPSGEQIAVTNWYGESPKLFFINVTNGQLIRTIDLSSVVARKASTVRASSYSPDGQWIAILTHDFPKGDPRYVAAVDLLQPRIHLIHVATGEICETIISPQAIAQSLTFSPDGKTLASGGNGQVLMWDLSTPPTLKR
ncbi:MAG: WD40 repeat domain-containing protein [Planctomycetaceae bacterium]|nr:WD40 repeat domain-containing protein [Planctomycetaceae bacterium]